VLFVLVLVAGCSLFLAATTKATVLLYVFGAAFVALCGYVYVLGRLRQREQEPAPYVAPARRPAPAPRSGDRWQHAV
jgi:arginine exporter protein ArgO